MKEKLRKAIKNLGNLGKTILREWKRSTQVYDILTLMVDSS